MTESLLTALAFQVGSLVPQTALSNAARYPRSVGGQGAPELPVRPEGARLVGVMPAEMLAVLAADR